MEVGDSVEPCRACAAALRNPYSGAMDEACRGCRVRYFSTLPRDARQKLVDLVRVAEGDEAAQRLELEIRKEYGRRQALRNTGP